MAVPRRLGREAQALHARQVSQSHSEDRALVHPDDLQLIQTIIIWRAVSLSPQAGRGDPRRPGRSATDVKHLADPQRPETSVVRALSSGEIAAPRPHRWRC
jgi:hypothetical protein